MRSIKRLLRAMQSVRILALCTLLATVTNFATAQDISAERFGEQQFVPNGGFVLRVGQDLPQLVWENPAEVAKLLDQTKIPTRWFNEQFEEVRVAADVGRYYAYGEAPTPTGPPLRRAMTCCCVPADFDLEVLAAKLINNRGNRSPPSKDRQQVQSLIDRWTTTEPGAVELAALHQGAAPTSVREGQWQMDNATQQVRLKRKLMGWDTKPLIVAAVQPFDDKPSPILRDDGKDTGIPAERVRRVETKLDQWFADSKEPMAVVIAKHGRVVIAKGYGQVDGKPATIHTPMLLHSAMKPLIGLQLAMYVDQGHIKLDEPIGNYLPDFDTKRDRNLTFRAGHVHATGIHFPWELAFRRLFYFHTWHESLIAHCKREWEPGAKQRYGVVGVILSVRALELLRGRNYWDAMERDLFQPLGIKDVLPGGTGFSADAMARIGVVLANRGKFGSQQVISEQTYSAIIPTGLATYFPGIDRPYGIGLQNHAHLLGPSSYGHGGGCGTLLSVNPDKHLVFSMVRNGPGKDYRKHRDEVLALLRQW